MTHIRAQLRRAAVTELKAGAASFAARVYSSRIYSFKDADLPACNVIIDTEESTLDTMCTNVLNRTALLNTEVYAKGIEAMDEVLDDLCVEVENVMGTTFLDGLAKSVILTNSSFGFTGEGEQPVATAVLSWSVNYVTPDGDPETAG